MDASNVFTVIPTIVSPDCHFSCSPRPPVLPLAGIFPSHLCHPLLSSLHQAVLKFSDWNNLQTPHLPPPHTSASAPPEWGHHQPHPVRLWPWTLRLCFPASDALYLAGLQNVDLLFVHRVSVFLQKTLWKVLHLEPWQETETVVSAPAWPGTLSSFSSSFSSSTVFSEKSCAYMGNPQMFSSKMQTQDVIRVYIEGAEYSFCRKPYCFKKEFL